MAMHVLTTVLMAAGLTAALIIAYTIAKFIKLHTFNQFGSRRTLKANSRLFREASLYCSDELKEYAELFGIDGNGANVDTHDILIRGRALKRQLVREGITEAVREVRRYIRNGYKEEASKPASVVSTVSSVSHVVRNLINKARLIGRQIDALFVGRVEGGDRDGEPSSNL